MYISYYCFCVLIRSLQISNNLKNFKCLLIFSLNGNVFDLSGPPKGESNYEEAIEFDPIIHHNQFCPWVNGNVAAAGCSNGGSSSTVDIVAHCGWQLTLDALDALRSLGHLPIQTVQSESAASLYKVCWSSYQ